MLKTETIDCTIKVNGVCYTAYMGYEVGNFCREDSWLESVVPFDSETDNELHEQDFARDLWQELEERVFEVMFEDAENDITFDDYVGRNRSLNFDKGVFA